MEKLDRTNAIMLLGDAIPLWAEDHGWVRVDGT